jgi:hypothetical protein
VPLIESKLIKNLRNIFYAKISFVSYVLFILCPCGGAAHRVHIFLEMYSVVCLLSWSVHCNFTGDGKCNKRGWACTPHPARANFTLITECTPESSGCNSVYSVVQHIIIPRPLTGNIK